MRFFHKTNLFSKKQENSKPKSFSCRVGPRYEGRSFNYEALANEGYSKNVVVYRCISLIAKSLSSIDISSSGGTIQQNKSVMDLLTKPNSEQSGAMFLEAMASYLLLSGNSYLYISRSPLSMQLLRPDRVEIVPNDDNTGVSHYLYKVGDKSIKITDVENVIHLKLFNPLSDWYGFSPVQAAAQAIDQHNAVSTHNLALLKNEGRPSACVILRNDMPLSPQQREQMRKDLATIYGGTRNAGSIAVFEGNFEWRELGLSPRDLDYYNGKNITAREIAQVFGVPPMLIGIKGDSTFANYREARFHLWEDTILPLAEYFKNELSNWLERHLSKNIVLKIDLDSIPALSLKRDSVWNRITNCDFLSDKEKKQLLGLV